MRVEIVLLSQFKYPVIKVTVDGSRIYNAGQTLGLDGEQLFYEFPGYEWPALPIRINRA